MAVVYQCPKCGEWNWGSADASEFEGLDVPELEPADEDGDSAVCGACDEESPLDDFATGEEDFPGEAGW
jgi:hypothetical protein